MNAIEIYMKYFETKSKKNEFFGQLSGHVILGQITKQIQIPQENYYDDNRVHLLLIQRSGTGKTAGSDVFLDITNELGLAIHPLDDFSDASAAGTVIQDEDNREETHIREGFLGNSDIVHSDEASTLFDPARHQARMLNFIQKACNPIGSAGNIINRSLSPGAINTTSTSSFLFTTFPPENQRMIATILNSGIMQRMMFFPRVLDTATKKDMSREVGKQMFKRGSDQRALDENPLEGDVTLTDVVQAFAELRDIYEDVVEIEIPQQLETFVLQKIDFMYDFIHTNIKRDDIKEKAEDFVNRWTVMIRKLATHKAILDKKFRIRKSDMVYAWRIIHKIMIATAHYIETVMTMENLYDKGKGATNHEIIYEAYDRIKDNEYEGVPKYYVSKTDLMQRSMLISGHGQSWFNKERKSLVDMNYIKTANIKSRERYYLVLPRNATIEHEGTYASGEKPKISKQQKKEIERKAVFKDRKKRKRGR